MSEIFDLGELNVPATIYRKKITRSDSGSQKIEWIPSGDILVSITEEKLEGKSIESNYTEVGALKINCWNYPITTEDRIEIENEMYSVVNVSILKRGYYKSINLSKNDST